MHILIFEFNGGVLGSGDIRAALKRKGVTWHTVSYCFGDTNSDDFFTSRFGRVLDEGRFDAVFSINYFPLVARCCHSRGIKYLAWSFDCPLNAERVEETLGLGTNHVFLFDRVHAGIYRDKGFDHVYHLPLAVNTRRLDAIRLTEEERQRFGAPISFVGKFYEPDLPRFEALMDEYDRGFIHGICSAQTGLQGVFLPDELPMDRLVDRINAFYARNMKEPPVINREWLEYEIAKTVTRRERLTLIKLLSEHLEMKLYSTECPDILTGVEYMGTCDASQELPRVFKSGSINLHTTLRYIRSGIPQRVIDILGAGGLALTDYQPELEEHFVNGEDLVIYDSPVDALEKAQYLLSHPQEAEEIRKRGHAKAAEHFSYEERFETIFKTAGL